MKLHLLTHHSKPHREYISDTWRCNAGWRKKKKIHALDAFVYSGRIGYVVYPTTSITKFRGADLHSARLGTTYAAKWNDLPTNAPTRDEAQGPNAQM